MGIEIQFDQFKKLEYWQSLCPELTITEPEPLTEISSFGKNLELRTGDWEVCKDLINQDGYFAYDSWYQRDLIDRLSKSFATLDAQGIPCVFAFVYDELGAFATTGSAA